MTTNGVNANPPTESLLITFDLDDTIFPIKPAVEEANVAQLRAMKQLAGYPETTMEQCMVQTRAIRQTLTQPITYTDLRKGAIRAELERIHGNNDDVAQQVVEQCFDAWLQERHASAERHLFPETIPALQELQSTLGQKYNLCMAGITNGRGNPLCMPSTEPFFQFCVSGEDANVFPHRKPHPNIYKAALEQWQQLVEEAMPTVWIHVGDCLANDVGASSDVGAKAIWVAPSEEPEDGEQPSWSTATAKDLKERAKLMEAARSKMSGKVTNLSQLTTVVQDIVSKELAAAETVLNS
ncbi:expressed unknown protein [Seminavis robusta]|uniref:Uncharacterized protein n=1 Tax=Seminavis robusta TaxID=568900 RepID=A0A9N8E8W4_9STRA|nr:expressed unknown protein [Seminavis robusta]|eukprot:Sro814_g206260.1 n/a (296) ;mRNA; f:4143-5030